MKKRYIILPKEKSTSKAMKTLQHELGVKLVSSAELNSKVKTKDIFNRDKGLFFKNIGVSVVEMEEEKLKEILSKDNNILYSEAEREFYPVEEIERDEHNELKKLTAIKSTLELLNLQVTELEKDLKKKENKEDERDEKNEKILQNYTFNMKALGVEKSHYSGKDINIAILDTGFYAEHPDFQERKIEGKSFIEGEKWDYDGAGHGTHCTGVATGNLSLTEQKRYGVAYNANIFIGKVLSDSSRGLTSNILDGIDWALEKQCKVISLSLGSPVEIGEKPSAIFEHVGRKALKKGTLIVAASGNNSHRPNQLPKPVSSPANVESIMAVSALTENLTIAPFSNAGLNASDGGKVDVAAPGVHILSCYSKNAKDSKLYKSMNGTSMATPHVAGLLALYFEAFPHLSALEIWLKLEKNALELKHQRKRDVGAGLAQAI